MRKYRRSRVFLISFIGTIALLSSSLAYLYYSVNVSQGIEKIELPSPVPSYSSVWGKYVPYDALQVSFENLTRIREFNSSIPPINNVLQIVSPSISITTQDISAIESVVLSNPNVTLDILFIKRDRFASILQEFKKEGQFPVKIWDATLYYVTRELSTGRELGWLGVIPLDSAIAFSSGSYDAKKAISISLAVANKTIDSIISREEVKEMLYTVGGADNHLAIGIQNFAGVVRTSEMTITAVDIIKGNVRISYIVHFRNQEYAYSQISYVKSVYLSARIFKLYGSNILAIEEQPLSKLEASVRLVGG